MAMGLVARSVPRALPRATARIRWLVVARTIGVVTLAAVVVGIAGAIALSVLGLRPLVVISGSMEPGLPIGTVVLSQTVAADEVAVGDVVTTDRFNGPGTVTHRVVGVADADGDTRVLTLKGDANAGVDREPYEVREVGVTRLVIPYAGLPQLWLEDILGFGADA